jgi:hypothetical protein
MESKAMNARAGEQEKVIKTKPGIRITMFTSGGFLIIK